MNKFRQFRFLAASVLSLGCAALAPAGAAAEDTSLEALAAIVEAWRTSPHADHGSLSFTYWNKDGAVPENCAACHSEPGFIDYLGADGSAPGLVDHPAAINSVIGCASCHTEAAHALDSAALPSGVTLEGLGANAGCTVCHAGRAAGDTVAAAIQGLDEDTVSADLGFINVHYGIAAAVMQGGAGRAGFHYPGRTYAGPFLHVRDANTCIACHDVHTTKVETDGCLSCHRGVEKLVDIRMRHADFDGDSDNSKGIQAEILGLHARLGAAIQAYARDISGTPIGYAKGTFPYYFTDTDGNGVIGEDEAAFPNRYRSWTPRLLKAAYNYQVAAKDPGAYVHNPAYVLQLLHDSLENLSERVSVDMQALSRP
ncbi:polyheme membrane-associated cytochrome C [Hoeflea sp.]|uniref:polyheme membrane-associated cytochrome C n=1 Tax=Hoeflea sp. TaxID=1940281 RepID=UPI0019859352|nr:polyheme membrane-associated cytochrome C [Hoeflea sp.]MBC7285352.1 polyheme membrane-associated cytochrome C [Hoeflea sp.]